MQRKHKTLMGKIFGTAWDAIKSVFTAADKTLLKLAISITNAVKDALNSGITDFITKLIPGDLDDKIVEILRAKLPVLLADELLIEAAGEITTEEQARELGIKLVDSFGGLSDEKKERLYTSLAAEIYIFLQKHAHGEKVTFGEGAALAESMYRSWLESKDE